MKPSERFTISQGQKVYSVLSRLLQQEAGDGMTSLENETVTSGTTKNPTIRRSKEYGHRSVTGMKPTWDGREKVDMESLETISDFEESSGCNESSSCCYDDSAGICSGHEDAGSSSSDDSERIRSGNDDAGSSSSDDIERIRSGNEDADSSSSDDSERIRSGNEIANSDSGDGSANSNSGKSNVRRTARTNFFRRPK